MNNQTVPDDVIEDVTDKEAALLEHRKLVAYFRREGFFFGHEEDSRSLSAAETAIHFMQTLAQLQRQREAVAQHEVGVAVPFGTLVTYPDGTEMFNRTGEPFPPVAHGYTVIHLYTTPLPQGARELLEKAIAECEKAKVIGTGSKAVDAVHNGAVDDCIKYIRALIPTEKEPSTCQTEPKDTGSEN